MKSYPSFFLSLALLTGLAFLTPGCATQDGAMAPRGTDSGNLEETADFVLLDKWARDSVTCSTVKYSYTPDGRLVISANVRNRRGYEIPIQMSCVFKDDLGVGVGDETPFVLDHLAANETRTFTFTAKDDRAKKATIRVRKVN